MELFINTKALGRIRLNSRIYSYYYFYYLIFLFYYNYIANK